MFEGCVIFLIISLFVLESIGSLANHYETCRLTALSILFCKIGFLGKIFNIESGLPIYQTFLNTNRKTGLYIN